MVYYDTVRAVAELEFLQDELVWFQRSVKDPIDRKIPYEHLRELVMVDIPGCERCGEGVVAEAEGAGVVIDAGDFLDGARDEVQRPVAYRPNFKAIFASAGDEVERRLVGTAYSD